MQEKSAEALEMAGIAGSAPGASPLKSKAAPEETLPPLALACAGLAVFDALIAGALIVTWTMQPQMVLTIIQTMAGVSLLLGVAPIVAGGLILNHNRQNYMVQPGTSWARVGIMSGLLLLAATVMIPLISALALLVGHVS